MNRFAADLKLLGWEPWLDKRIEFGDTWRSEITRGLLESQHVLAFLSKHSTRKPGVCRQEVAIALGPAKCRVYTVLVEPLAECRPPLVISHKQWLDMQEWRTLAASDPPAYDALYQRSLSEVVRVLERNEPFAGEIEELYRWLDPIDSTADMITAEQGFTGRELLLKGVVEHEAGRTGEGDGLGEIERWRTDGSPNPVLVLAAEPGWGKSAVAARLAHVGRARVMAVHFCKHDRPNTRDARSVLRTLAFQMATQLDEYRDLLVQRARQGVALADLNAAELFHELLKTPLAHVIQGGRGAHDRHLIVLDALDETVEPHKHHSELVTLFASEFGGLPDWIGLVVTSRPEASVLRQFGRFGVRRLDAGGDANRRDIAKHVDTWLNTLPLDASSRPAALQAILVASANNFLYVRMLQEAVSRSTVQLHQLTDASLLPEGLSGLYEKWFQDRFGNHERYGEVRPLLEMMVAARESLPMELAAIALEWGPYDRPKRLEALGSLCTRPDKSTLVFFHKSLRDWLVDPDRSGVTFHASEAEGHRRLAVSMADAVKTWRADGEPVDESSIGGLSQNAESYLLRHLPMHLRQAGREAECRRLLTDFAFAMRRCAAGAVDAMLEDYGEMRTANRDDALAVWAECLAAQGYLLRRGNDEWPAHKILLQVAIDDADDSPITKAAEEWLDRGACDWVWLRRKNRPPLRRRTALLAVLEGHSESIRGAQVLPDGRILSWSEDKTLRLWDGQTGAPLAVWEGHSGSVDGVHVLPDGRILSWSFDKTLRLWDGKTGAPLTVLEGHSQDVVGVQVLPDGRILVLSDEAKMSIWDLNNAVCIASGALPALREWLPLSMEPSPETFGRAERFGSYWVQSIETHFSVYDRTLRLLAQWHGNDLYFDGLASACWLVTSDGKLCFLRLMLGAAETEA